MKMLKIAAIVSCTTLSLMLSILVVADMQSAASGGAEAHSASHDFPLTVKDANAPYIDSVDAFKAFCFDEDWNATIECEEYLVQTFNWIKANDHLRDDADPWFIANHMSVWMRLAPERSVDNYDIFITDVIMHEYGKS